MGLAIDYNDKVFKAISNSDGGEVGGETTFHYHQQDDILWGTYAGGSIRFGTITGRVLPDSILEFSYQHVNDQNEIMTGKCKSTPELTSDNKIRLKETWQWTCKDFSEGMSIIEEV